MTFLLVLKILGKKTKVALISLVFLLTSGCGEGNKLQSPSRALDPKIELEDTRYQVKDFDALVVAALGDSITAGFNTATLLQNNFAVSWSTGDRLAPLNGSHYQRLQQVFYNTTVNVRAINFAITGSKVITSPESGLKVQAQRMSSALNDDEFNYVTLLMGGNDICNTGRDLDNFSQAFENHLKAATGILLPKADLVLFSSLPDIDGALNGLTCNLGDEAFQIIMGQVCPNVLNFSRAELRDYVQAVNDAFASVASLYPKKIIFDNHKLYDLPVTQEGVSPIDCFHPSPTGQKAISEALWPLVLPTFQELLPEPLVQ